MLAADEKLQSVEIIGSPFGTDWALRHEDNAVRMIFSDGETVVKMEDFRQAVFAFADCVEGIYLGCSPKKISEKWENDAYIAFWNEWRRRRKE